MVPNEELPVLESLISIRNRLTALKKDRTEYIRAKDVLAIYSSLMNEVTRLNDIRTPATPRASTSSSTRSSLDGESRLSKDSQTIGGHAHAAAVEEEEDEGEVEENRVDTILNDVFQLLSLFFLTIGKSRESPATFCQLATMKRLLTHLAESGIYTAADLKPFQTRLVELKRIITSGHSFAGTLGNPGEVEEREEGLTKLLLAKWDDCERLLTKLVSSLSHLSTDLNPLHHRLITLRRLLASIASRARPTSADIAHILKELRDISDRRHNNKFVVGIDPSDGKPIVPIKGQALLNGLLEDNFEICEDIKAREGAEDVARGPLQAIYDRLSELRAQLERLVLTHRWTLRETDLYNFQMALQEIDGMRVNGKFVDADGNVPTGQLVLLYLLRRCFGLCYRLMASSEPISEELMPIANKLETIKRCLIEVQKFGGPYSQRDLYPFQLSLAQIDALRTDGRFQGRDGNVPEGQAILNALLSEAHEIVGTMQEEGME